MKNTILWLCLFLIGQVEAQNVDITTIETCAYRSEGEIHFEINPSFVSGYSLPFIVEWQNTTNKNEGEMETNSLVFDLTGLEAGIFDIRIKLGSSCQIDLEVEVAEIPVIDLDVIRKIDKPQCGYSNGNLILIPENGFGPYLFDWDVEATTFPHPDIPGAFMLANIIAGRYCVTVTDQACGYAEFCVDVEQSLPSVTIDNVENINGCQSNMCNGEIELSVSGVDTYTVEWEDSNEEIIGSGPILEGLCEPGLYLAYVYFSDHCPPWIYDVNLNCCGGGSSIVIDLESELGCNGGNSIETNVTGGTPPYLYLWNNSSHLANLEDLPNGSFSVTVTDANGCTASENVSFNPIEQIEVVNPCAGFFDGSVTYQINNPDNCSVSVQYDFSICNDCSAEPVIENNTNSTITFTLDELGGGINYLFHVSICGCYQAIHFNLTEDPFARSFVDFEEVEPDVYLCTYDLDCNTNHLEEAEQSLATVDLNHEECDPTAWPRPCGHIDYYCDLTEPPIATREIKKKLMRRGEAILLAQDLGVYSPEEIEFQLSGNPCDRLFVCPNAPVCQGLGFVGEFGGHFVGTTMPDANGCYKVKCKFLGLLGIGFSYNVCGKDYLPDYLAAYYDPTIPISIHINQEPCVPVEKSVFEIMQYMDDLIDDEPGFNGSELHGFLLTHLELETESRFCAKVSYCSSNFKFLWSDIDEIECTMDPGIEYGECHGIMGCTPCPVSLYNGFFVWCADDCPDRPGMLCSVPKFIPFDYENFDLDGFQGPTPPQIISRSNSSTEFLSFSPAIQNNNFTTVNAIYQGGNEKLYHPFSYDRLIPYKIDGIEYLFQHFDSSYIFALLKDSSESYTNTIFYGDVGDLQATKIKASQDLIMKKTWSGIDYHFTTGSFKGDLELNGDILGSSPINDQYFILKMDREANSVNFRKIKKHGWNIFIDEQSGNVGLWSPLNQPLYIDDQLNSGISPGEIVTLDGSSSEALRDINLILPSTMKLLEYKRGPVYSGYIIVGSGSITLQGSPVYNNATSQVLLLTIKNQGTGSLIKWIKNYALSAIDTSAISLEMIGLDTICLALNTTNTITVENNDISNFGAKDIVILSYNASGNLILDEHYGSSSSEMLRDLYFANGILHLGGELSGSSFKRTIGDLDFANFSPSLSHSFISYKIIYDDTQSEDALPSEENVALRTSILPKVDVYPSPADEEITISATQDCNIVGISIRDVNGRIIATEVSNREELSSGVTIKVLEWPSGVYFANIRSDCGQLISKPFIIIH